MPRAAVFDEIYANYLAEVAALDLDCIAARLGLDRDGDAVVVPFYGSPFRVSGPVHPAVRRPGGGFSGHGVPGHARHGAGVVAERQAGPRRRIPAG